jgi:hypothetical protein
MRKGKGSTVTEEELKALAEAMVNGDHIDVFIALEPVLTAKQYKDLADITDLCRIHHCDREICLDDKLRCQQEN